MKNAVLVLAASIALVLVSDPTYAQAPPSPATTPATAQGAPEAPAGGKVQVDGKVKEIRQACRDQLKGQGLKGEERVKAVSACVVKERPDLAQREQCRMDGWSKGLRKHELQGFVKDCIEAKG